MTNEVRNQTWPELAEENQIISNLDTDAHK